MNIIKPLLIASLVASPAAWAGHNYNKSYKNTYSPRYDYAKVVEAAPITKTIRVSTPRQECWEEEVVYRDRRHRSATPVILGSIIGGVLGNELGHHKSAKRAGAVAGALLGGSIGRDIGRRHAGNSGKYYGTEQVCKTYEDYHEEERVVGYDVTYKYHGEVYHTQTTRDPGKRMKVRVSVTPVTE